MTEKPHSYAHGKIVSLDFPDTANHSYQIVIGESILTEIGTLISVRFGKKRCIVITDSNIAPLYLTKLEEILRASGHLVLPSITINAGEGSKDFASLQSVLERMMKNGIDRKSMVIAFGGGVVGDLTGLAAALALRGIDFMQVPTTLLAQVDSSVGGKTAVNTGHGKNTVGAFYQPRLVVADVALLDSLPKRQMLAGYAEVVKYGLIRDARFFEWCEENGSKLLGGNREAQIYAVNSSCKHKADVVTKDERESGERAILNLGHSFGHALEAYTGYSDTLLHGEAVAIGMVMAFTLSGNLQLCSPYYATEIREHLSSVGLPVSPKPYVKDIDKLMAYMKQDKKVQDGKMVLILAEGIGKAFISRNAKEQDVRELWKSFLQD